MELLSFQPLSDENYLIYEISVVDYCKAFHYEKSRLINPRQVLGIETTGLVVVVECVFDAWENDYMIFWFESGQWRRLAYIDTASDEIPYEVRFEFKRYYINHKSLVS